MTLAGEGVEVFGGAGVDGIERDGDERRWAEGEGRGQLSVLKARPLARGNKGTEQPESESQTYRASSNSVKVVSAWEM